MYPLKDKLLDRLKAENFLFPTSYVVLDAETTAKGALGRLPLQLALIKVTDGEVEDVAEWFLDWRRGFNMPADVLADEINKIGYIFAAKGERFPITYEMICEQGAPALPAVTAFLQKLTDCITAGTPIVGHNIRGFDIEMLNDVVARYFPELPIPWEKAAVYDTGLFEKALNLDLIFYSGESFNGWQNRVAKVASTVKWNLAGCITKYGLHEKLASGASHNAVYDCMAVVQLVNAFNAMLKG